MPVHDWSRVVAGVFHDFHVEWTAAMKRALNGGILPEGWYAMIEQRTGGPIADLLTLEARPPREAAEVPPHDDGRTTAVALAPPRVRLHAVAEAETYARLSRRLVVRHASNDRVVAVAEVLSPGNKGSDFAWRSFIVKSLELLDAGVHLLAIDLFPPGPRDPRGLHGALWEALAGEAYAAPDDAPLTLASYAAGTEVHAYVEPTAVGRRLIDMPLFLTAERYVSVPLEATYAEAYAAVPVRWREVIEAGPGPHPA
jgi:hypothetical protein